MSENNIHDFEQNNTATINKNSIILINILRVLTMLENALNRLMRNNFYDRSQYPEEFLVIETLILNIRG